jgi:flagellum-specific peptidoglycan hydrolase FlgJ
LYRSNLVKSQRDFLSKLIPLCRLISEWTYSKSEFIGVRSPRGVSTSLLLAEILLKSDWGTHPISQMDFFNKYSNNLSLELADDDWKGKSHTFREVKYKAYRDWESYGVSRSDEFVFNEKYRELIKKARLLEQVKELSKFNEHPEKMCANIELYINAYQLWEFD